MTKRQSTFLEKLEDLMKWRRLYEEAIVHPRQYGKSSEYWQQAADKKQKQIEELIAANVK